MKDSEAADISDYTAGVDPVLIACNICNSVTMLLSQNMFPLEKTSSTYSLLLILSKHRSVSLTVLHDEQLLF